MNEWFGLGIALELRDRMSQGLETARNSFERFRSTTQQSVQDVEAQIDRLNSLQITGALLSGTGSMLTGMGASLLNPVVNLGKEVINTSSQFEQWRMTLKALYKDADVATEKLAWGMKLASTTPFEMTDVTQALIGFKAVGAEADTMFTNANGQARSFLEYMGDLAALRPDVGLEGVMLGVRNLLGGDGGKSLKMRMDIDFENILGRDFGTTTEEIMQDLVTVSDQLAGGLMTELEGTWSQLISNLKDQATRLYLAIGDNGAFDMFKNSLKGFSDIINSIDDDRMAKIGKNIAEAFKMIWKPVQWVINGLQSVLKVILKLAESDSVFSKLVLGVTAFVGSLLALTGVMLTLGGGFIQTVSSLGIFLLMLQTSPLKFAGILTSLKLLAMRLLPLIAVMGALAVAWKTDFMGIKTTMTNFTNTIRTAWSEANRISSLGVTDMLAELDKLDTKTFGGWLTYNLVKLMVLWEALCEAWNTNELSDETFQKVNALGLLPLLSNILDMKMRVEAFFKGFMEGASVVGKIVVGVFKALWSVIRPVADLILEATGIVLGFRTEVEGGVNTEAWQSFGKVIGFLTGMFLVYKGVMLAVSGVMAVWNTITTIASAVTTAFGVAMSILTSPITLVIVAILGVVTALVYCYNKFDWFKTAVDTTVQAIASVLMFLWNGVFIPLLDFVKEVFVATFITSFSLLSSGITVAVDTIKGVINGIKTILQGIIDFVVGVFTGNWERAWQGVVNIFDGIFSTLGTLVKAPLNAIIGAINAVINGLNSLNFDIPDWVPGFGGKSFGINIPNIPKLNTGGYIKDEGLSYLHPNEVVINDELTQKLRNFLNGNTTSSANTKAVQGNSTSTTNDNSVTFNEGAIQINLQQGSEADATKLAKMIMEKIKRETQLRSTLNYNAI